MVSVIDVVLGKRGHPPPPAATAEPASDRPDADSPASTVSIAGIESPALASLPVGNLVALTWLTDLYAHGRLHDHGVIIDRDGREWNVPATVYRLLDALGGRNQNPNDPPPIPRLVWLDLHAFRAAFTSSGGAIGWRAIGDGAEWPGEFASITLSPKGRVLTKGLEQ